MGIEPGWATSKACTFFVVLLFLPLYDLTVLSPRWLLAFSLDCSPNLALLTASILIFPPHSSHWVSQNRLFSLSIYFCNSETAAQIDTTSELLSVPVYFQGTSVLPHSCMTLSGLLQDSLVPGLGPTCRAETIRQ